MSSGFHERLASTRWLYRWAVLTVCATFVLLFLGSVVTTFRVGMADPIWPTYPWHLLLISWDEPSPGFLIEHGHRLAGYIVGCCVIVLTLGLWRLEIRSWVRWLGGAALLGVIVQGLLGGFRVKLHALLGPNLAMIHGIFAQVVFAMLVALAAVISPRWVHGAKRCEESRRLGLLSASTTMLLFLQIILGAWIRHMSTSLGQRLHFLGAFAAVVAVVWLVSLVWNRYSEDGSLVAPVMLLAGLVLVQILLGVEAWMFKYGSGIPLEMQQITIGQAVVRTLHVLTGFGILGTSVLVTMRAHWKLGMVETVESVAACRLEGAL